MIFVDAVRYYSGFNLSLVNKSRLRSRFCLRRDKNFKFESIRVYFPCKMEIFRSNCLFTVLHF